MNKTLMVTAILALLASGATLATAGTNPLACTADADSEASNWDASNWDASNWDASNWDASNWDASNWDGSNWDGSNWDGSNWDVSVYGAGVGCEQPQHCVRDDVTCVLP